MKFVSLSVFLVAINVIGSSIIFVKMSGLNSADVVKVAQSFFSKDTSSRHRLMKQAAELGLALKQKAAEEAAIEK
jgi:hypothetical protein